MTQEKLHIQTQLTNWLLRRTAQGGVRRVAPLAAAIASELGNVRKDNQDRAVVARGRDRDGRDFAVVAVADGIGGMREGAICASMAIGALVATLHQQARSGEIEGDRWIREAVFAADKAVFTRYRADGGSTLVALVIRPGFGVHWVSVGDSRVYSYIGNSLTQSSVDDTIAGQLGKNIEGASEQSRLLQFVGMGSDLEPHISEVSLGGVETAILTTDGVHYLASSPNWLGQIVSNAPDIGACVKRLVELAKWCGGPDNATVAMISLSENWDTDDRPAYPCLEVWDAFGELQIVLDYPSTKVEAVQHPQVIGYPAGPQPSNTQPKNLVTEVTKSIVETSPAVSNAVKKPKVSSKKKAKAPAKVRQEDAPQLSMKFPTKPV